MQTPKTIEVVRTNLKGLSSLGTGSALAIVASLSKHYTSVTLTNVNTKNDLVALIERKPDLVFLGMKYVTDVLTSSQGIWLSEELENAAIPHTGSPSTSHELELNKGLAKQRVLDHGLATAEYYVLPINQPYNRLRLKLAFPLFVKPARGGGGEGIDEHSVVRTTEQLHHKIQSLRTKYAADVLIEAYLEGREFSVAIIKNQDSGNLIGMPLELIAPKNGKGESMLGYQVKSLNQEQAIAVTDPTERDQLITFALDAFRALGARDYGRIDIRFDANGVPHFLEANLIPSLISGYGSFPKAYKLNQAVEYDEMIANIASLGFSRTQLIA